MHYLEYNEQIQHRTGEYPLAFYRVDEHHPRYQMRVHWHRETELLRVESGVLHLYVDDESIEAMPGDLVVLGEGVLHGGEPEDCVYECVVFDPYALMMHVEPCKQAVKGLLLPGLIPFNLIKAGLNSVIFFILFKSLRLILDKRSA